MHLYYEYVASINVYIQHATEWSVEECRQTQALDAAPLSRFPSFLPHRFRGWFFGCFISIWASRALAEPLRRGGAPEGVPEVIFGVIFDVIFGVILDTVGVIKSRFWLYDARVTEGMNAFMNYGIFACFSFAFSHFSHFLRSLHWPFCIVWFAGGGRQADDGKRASHARDVR